MKARTFTLSLPDDLARKVERVAKEESRTRSELFREAVRRFMDARELETLRRQAAREAAKRGILTEEDVDELVHHSRREKVRS
jgi:CopG family transcriptional regulator / antitoxin EndoAI